MRRDIPTNRAPQTDTLRVAGLDHPGAGLGQLLRLAVEELHPSREFRRQPGVAQGQGRLAGQAGHDQQPGPGATRPFRPRQGWCHGASVLRARLVVEVTDRTPSVGLATRSFRPLGGAGPRRPGRRHVALNAAQFTAFGNRTARFPTGCGKAARPDRCHGYPRCRGGELRRPGAVPRATAGSSTRCSTRPPTPCSTTHSTWAPDAMFTATSTRPPRRPWWARCAESLGLWLIYSSRWRPGTPGRPSPAG